MLKNQLISGSTGKQVRCAPGALPAFRNLESLARSGNYWAGLIVRGVLGLTSGPLDKNNIYIEEKNGLAYGLGALYMVLPGVTAVLEKLPNDSYILQHINVDGNYMALQEDSMRPGLWQIKAGETVEAVFQADGEILNQKYRPVVISDTSKKDAKWVADKVRKDLSKIDGTMKRMVRINGFDLHFTPGERDLVGLKPAHKALSTSQDREITQSAQLLANTMYQARDIEGVLWYSDWGGSAILTRAMEILHQEKGISLKSHGIFLNRPTSRANYALELGKKLGLELQGKGKKSSFHPKELIGGIHISEVSRSGTFEAAEYTLGAGGAFFGVAGALGFVSGGVAIAGTAIGVVGSMHFVSKAIKGAVKNLPGKKY